MLYSTSELDTSSYNASMSQRQPKSIDTICFIHDAVGTSLYPQTPTTKCSLQLNVVIEQPHLLARFECRHADIRAAITSERVAQATITA